MLENSRTLLQDRDSLQPFKRPKEMDALSAALSAVRMTSANFYHAECTAPWGFAVPRLTPEIATRLAPGVERLVGFHFVADGAAVVRYADVGPFTISAGDVLIFPYGDAHTVVNGSPSVLVDAGASLARCLGGDLTPMRLGGGGAMTRFVCGYFGCERHADRLFLTGLPTMIQTNLRGDAAGQWVETSIRHLVSDAGADRPSRSVLLARAAEALFIESMRRYMAQLPPEQRGWLAGARDPVVGATLAHLHRRPSHPWTLNKLAVETGASRTVIVERFAEYLGEPPLTYLARWRLRLAARLLETTRKTILQVAGDVGYASEAAFNRAFKREYGVPPARYRRATAGQHAPVAPTGSTG